MTISIPARLPRRPTWRLQLAAATLTMAALWSPSATSAAGGAQSACVPSGGPVLAGRVLTQAEADVAGALRCADLTGAVLDGLDLTAHDLTGARLTGASLAGTRLGQARLGDATLDGAVLSFADLTQATLTGANLDGANLDAATLAEVEATGATFVAASMNEVILAQAILRDARLDGARLRGARIGGADLRGATLVGTELFAADLSGALMGPTSLRRADLRGADLSEIDFDGVDLSGAVLDAGAREALGLVEAAERGPTVEGDRRRPPAADDIAGVVPHRALVALAVVVFVLRATGTTVRAFRAARERAAWAPVETRARSPREPRPSRPPRGIRGERPASMPPAGRAGWDPVTATAGGSGLSPSARRPTMVGIAGVGGPLAELRLDDPRLDDLSFAGIAPVGDATPAEVGERPRAHPPAPPRPVRPVRRGPSALRLGIGLVGAAVLAVGVHLLVGGASGLWLDLVAPRTVERAPDVLAAIGLASGGAGIAAGALAMVIGAVASAGR